MLPSTLKLTPAIEILSEAVAESVTEAPETVEPLVGAVRETVGSVLSGIDVVVNVFSVEVDIFPRPSAETTT